MPFVVSPLLGLTFKFVCARVMIDCRCGDLGLDQDLTNDWSSSGMNQTASITSNLCKIIDRKLDPFLQEHSVATSAAFPYSCSRSLQFEMLRLSPSAKVLLVLPVFLNWTPNILTVFIGGSGHLQFGFVPCSLRPLANV
jgi:hypothetical protein